MSFKKAVTGVTVSPTGEFMCTSHHGRVGLSVWADQRSVDLVLMCVCRNWFCWGVELFVLLLFITVFCRCCIFELIISAYGVFSINRCFQLRKTRQYLPMPMPKDTGSA